MYFGPEDQTQDLKLAKQAVYYLAIAITDWVSFCFKTGSYYVDQAGPELTEILPSCFPSARIQGEHHHTQTGWILTSSLTHVSAQKAEEPAVEKQNLLDLPT